VGCISLLVNNGKIIWFYGAVFSCITLCCFWSTISKDYDEQELFYTTGSNIAFTG
jgi:hypothetical protein